MHIHMRRPGRRFRRGVTVAVLLAAAVLTEASPAYAASGVSVLDGTLTITNEPRKQAHLMVTQDGADVVVRETQGNRLTVGLGCWSVSPTEVRCPAIGISWISVELGDQDDDFHLYVDLPGDIFGGSGNDILQAFGDNRVELSGDAGDDHLGGGNGNDLISGGPGNDLLLDSSGNDVLTGGDGDDTIRFTPVAGGADSAYGGAGRDRVVYPRSAGVRVSLNDAADDGEPGERDNIHGDVEDIETGRGDDVLFGNDSDNWLNGGSGDDLMLGLAGNDTFTSSGGTDTAYGGAGDDTYLASFRGAVGEGITFVGGPGTDTASYAARTGGVIVVLDDRANDGGPGERDKIDPDVEIVRGGSGDDQFVGNQGSNAFYGGRGDDVMFGLGGNDLLHDIDSVAGNDTLDGGAGTDWCMSDTGDTLQRCEG